MSEKQIWLVVGLGNPGPKYANNRHNIGFRVVDQLLTRLGGRWREKFEGMHDRCKTPSDTSVVLLKPLTFMNLSGRSVQKAAKFFNVPRERIIVVHDELDVDFPMMRLKNGGGTAGHNGLKSMVQCLGGNDFARLRVGIGRPPGRIPVASYVLMDYSKDEKPQIPDIIDRACDMVLATIEDGVETAMNRHN